MEPRNLEPRQSQSQSLAVRLMSGTDFAVRSRSRQPEVLCGLSVALGRGEPASREEAQWEPEPHNGHRCRVRGRCVRALKILLGSIIR